MIRVSGDSATVIGMDSGEGIIVPSAIFFAQLSATLKVSVIGRRAFASTRIISITISRHVQSSLFRMLFLLPIPLSAAFKRQSELTIIESRVFSFSSLKSIRIPRHVQVLCSECFSHCSFLSSISFETDSELTRIESAAFFGTKVRLVLSPRDISFIAGNALPRDCQIAIADGELSRDLREWNDRRQAGSPDGFERMTQGTVELEPTRLSDFHS
jgi:hypothetical protein